MAISVAALALLAHADGALLRSPEKKSPNPLSPSRVIPRLVPPSSCELLSRLHAVADVEHVILAYEDWKFAGARKSSLSVRRF